MTLKIEYRTSWLAAAIILLISLWILRSFVAPLAWASILVLATWRAYQRFAHLLRRQWRSNLTPLLFTALVSLAVLGPVVFAFGALVEQPHIWAQLFMVAGKQGLSVPAWLGEVPVIGPWLVDQWHATFETPGGIALMLQHADTRFLFGWAGSFGQLVVHHAFVVSFTVLGLFFLYRDGDMLAGHISRIVQARLGQRGTFYLDQAVVAVRATVYGTVLVGLIDGTLMGVAYTLAGVPSAEVWGAVTGLLAMLPFLAYVGVVAVASLLWAKGAGGAAFAVLGVGVAVVFAGDKIARPLLVGRAMKLGFLWVLLGSLGGLETLGLVGLFVGPVALALAGTLLREWIRADGLHASATVTGGAAAITALETGSPQPAHSPRPDTVETMSFRHVVQTCR